MDDDDETRWWVYMVIGLAVATLAHCASMASMAS